MKNNKINLITIAITIVLVSCLHEKSNPTINYTALACNGTTNDSSFADGNLTRIRSESVLPNTYQSITVRSNPTMDYMVHTNANPKALIILIAGGQMNSNITGMVGEQTSTASGNFLVRSAHLFAQQGYKVIALDRPTDWANYIDPAGSTKGKAFDGYRTSADHFDDLIEVINLENISPALPVVIAGTSRGSISAVAQASLADYIMLSAPITTGGSYIGSTGVLPSSLGNKPVHMIWHESDDCKSSTPSEANRAAGKFSNVTAVQVSGGINHPELSKKAKNKGCDGGKTYHGFLGIESCVVENATNWLDAQLKL